MTDPGPAPAVVRRSPNEATRVLVLDGAQRSALAATRSLGLANYDVCVAEELPRSLAGASRFCRSELCYPSPSREPTAFLDWFERRCELEDFAAALPMTEVTTDLLARHRPRWPNVVLPVAPIETIDALTDKVSLYRRAMRLGVAVPESVVVSDPHDLASAVQQIGFPAILKPRRSRLWTGAGFRSTSVRRAQDSDDLDRLIALPEFRDEPFLYQRQVPGEGRGVFALYRHGEPVAFFAHRRIREKPPEGGVSVLSESCAVDPCLLAHSRALLDEASWHGVAMVEYKFSPDEGPFLMEVNARFWGSLQLAIDAGIDFPRLLLDSELSGKREVPGDYRKGCRLRWFLGDVDRLYLVLKRGGGPGGESWLREIVNFARPDLSRTRHEVFRWSDPRPGLTELRHYLARLGRG